MNNDLNPWRRKFFLHWMVNNVVGFAAGSVFAEFIGHSIEARFGWQLGVLAAGLTFEAFVWLARILVLNNTKGFGLWRLSDTIIWLVSEGFGLLLAEGVYETGSSNVMIIGPLAGSVLGAMILVQLWIIAAQKKGSFLLFLRMILICVAGFFAVSFVVSAVFVLGQEIAVSLSKTMGQLWGVGIFSIIAGAFISLVTGFTYASLRIIRFYNPIPEPSM